MKKHSQKKEKKVKKHIHKFFVERGIGSSDGHIDMFDMACDCGLKMFINKPTIHRGDMDGRRVKFYDPEFN